MVRAAVPSPAERPTDFFISYSPADERWATWIAWELESAGYRTMIQAWDFVPGTNFIDFMDRGIREAAVMIAILSRSYLKSTYGRWEWQSAIRADPANPATRLVTIRVEDCPLEGLLSTITYVDLVGVTDPDEARAMFVGGIRHALAGRAKPGRVPEFPNSAGTLAGQVLPGRAATQLAFSSPEPRPAGRPGLRHARRTPAAPPGYPPALAAAPGPRETFSMLHVAGPRFGRGLAWDGEPGSVTDLQARIWADVTRLTDVGVSRPELLVVTGDLTETGGLREFEDALTFLAGLRALLSLEPSRLVVVPGGHDVTRAASRAYFATCEADDIEPEPPYWPKWRHFAAMFDELYRGLDGPVFDSSQPWTLFEIPDLRVVVAGLNSTIADSHREEDRYGWIGEAQAAWFAERLRQHEQDGWLRIGALRHAPQPGGGRTDPDTLRDAATLDRLLGRRLNLLLHGPSEAGPASGSLSSGLLVAPAAGPGRHEILLLSRDGLDRWNPRSGEASGAAEGPERVEHHWLAVGATFGADGGGLDGAAAAAGQADQDTSAVPDVEAGAERATSTVSGLLDRITEVIETRHPGAKVRRVADRPPFLVVTHEEDGFFRRWRAAAHVGELTRDDVDALVKQLRTGATEPGSELVYEGPRPAQLLREEALRRGVRLRSFTEFQGLLDLDDYLAGQAARLRSDRLYPSELYVPQRFTELDRPEQPTREDLVEELLRLLASDHGRFTLVLGDFGRGKTFALHELARRIPAQLPHLIPILIDLRALDKAHSVDGLVAAHLANHGEELIDLKAFHYMLRQGRIVLLFDGFDELVTRVTYDRAADHLETLLQAVEDKTKIVVASRTQHFQSDAQVLTALGERVGLVPHRRVLCIEDFTPAQVRTYLVNRYDGDEEAADARLELISGIEDLLGLSENPRMLSFIADLDAERLHAAASAARTISAAGLYAEILGSWLGYEEQRSQGVRGTSVGLRLDDLWRAVSTLALRLWECGEPFLRLGELTDEAAGSLAGLADGRLSLDQTAHAVGAGSLLVRTGTGLFGFIHSSVAEWLVASEIARQLNAGTIDPAPLKRRPLSQLTVDFLCDLAEPQACHAWAAGVLATTSADDVTRANAIRITTRLRTPARTDLRGAVLQGEDLSYRDLQKVDFTGADLTDARLVGANLTGAVLRDTRLTGARLDEARLTGADLRGADLARARLVRADLRGARFAGSRWTRAALIDVTADAGLRGTAELRDAAIAPGQPVETGLVPAAIGVPYGYHIQTTRLPEPVAYSSEGGVLAIGSEDGEVLLCDSVSGLPLRRLPGHRGRVYAVVYGPGNRVLASGASDGTVRLWDPATGECLHVLQVHPDGVWPVVISPDGRWLAVGAADGFIRLWDPETGEGRHQLGGHKVPVYTAVFDPACSVIATGDAAGSVRLWDLGTGVLRHEIAGREGPVYRLAFSPDGALLAAGDQGGSVRLFDAATAEPLHELTGHTGRVYTLAFHPKDPLLVTGDTDGGVRLWDAETGQLRRVLPEHKGGVYRVVFSPDGSQLASADSDGAVRLWDLAAGQVRYELTGHKNSVWPPVFRPDGRQLATSSNDGTARLWDSATGQCRHFLRGHGRHITSVTFSADSSLLAAGGNDGVVRLWDPATGQRRRELSGIADRLISAVFSPVGPVLATASNDGGVYLWNAESGGYEREMNVETEHVWAETFAPAGDVLATANDDDTVQLWYRTTGRRIRTLAEHRGRVRSIAFSPDGATIATGCDDQVVRLWDVESGILRASLSGHTDRVYSVAFDPEGKLLASASNDGTACLWSLSNGEVLVTLTGHGGRLWTSAFSPDGSMLATAGDDLAVRLWDPHTGQLMHTLAGHTRRVWSVAFSPDGRVLAAAGDDGTVRLWRLGLGAPVPLVTLLGLPEGWVAFGPDGRYKIDGDVTGQFWHVIGMCRFEPGELDPYLTDVQRLPHDAEF
jgi:WD40 repeat protein